MKLLMVAFGTAGDVFPVLALAQAAMHRGHEVALVVPKRDLVKVQALGLTACAMEERTPDKLLSSGRKRQSYGSWGKALTTNIVARQPMLYHAVEAAIDTFKPDALVAQHFGCAAAWAAQHYRVPWVMAATAPASWPSLDNPVMYSIMPDKDEYRRWLVRIGMMAGSIATTLMTDLPLNRIRKQLGLPRIRRIVLERMFEGQLNLGLWSPSFRGPAADDKPRSRICGFTWFDGQGFSDETTLRAAKQRLDEFFGAGEAPIVFTLGSFFSRNPGQFYGTALHACRQLGRRAIVLTDQRSISEKDEVLYSGFIPHSLVMPRAAAIVHHGGLGSTAQALRSGRPSVVVPWCLDQFDNARRSRLLGASITLRLQKLNPTVLADALRKILTEPGFVQRAQIISSRLQSEDGALAAIEALEQTVPSTKP